MDTLSVVECHALGQCVTSGMRIVLRRFGQMAAI